MSGAVEGVALLPCPFCGGEAAADSCVWTSRSIYTVGCSNTACEADCHFSGTESYAPLIVLWNTRTTPQARSYADAIEEAAKVAEVERDKSAVAVEDMKGDEGAQSVAAGGYLSSKRIAAAIRLLPQEPQP